MPPISDFELVNMTAKADRFWNTTMFTLILDFLATVSLIVLGFMDPLSAKFLVFYHAVMDAFIYFDLFPSYFGLVKALREHKMDYMLKEPPLSYAWLLIWMVPLMLFMGHFILVFGETPLDEWPNWLIGYNVVMLGIATVSYLLVYKLDLE